MDNSNLLLAAFAPGDLALIQPHLKPVLLEQDQVLHGTGDTVNLLYFPSNSIVSLVVELLDGSMVEAAMIGRDGVVGAASALDGRHAVSRAIVELGGDALTCDVHSFRNAAEQSPSLLAFVLRHEQALYGQAQQSAACNATHHVEARLCRWMLRARELSGSDILPFTQGLLAELLGVRRTSVSVVAHTLQQAGMIKYQRGRIQVIDLDALEQTACECYETVRAHYDTLLGRRRNI